jgi:hypothetical protein
MSLPLDKEEVDNFAEEDNNNTHYYITMSYITNSTWIIS